MHRIVLFILFAMSVGFAQDTTFSGVVNNLSGSPIPGISVSLRKLGWKGATDASGSWSFPGAGVGVRERAEHALGSSGRLRVVGGRIEFSLDGHDLSGRVRDVASAGDVVQRAAPRIAAGFVDTLIYAWKGKILARTPLVVSSASGLAKRIDTAWSDDHGTPWKDTVQTYGSLRDTRDGKVYRTVSVGSQTWMAENLAYASPGSQLPGGSVDSGAKVGRVYFWDDALALPDSCRTKACSTQVIFVFAGVCPAGWHLPDTSEWRAQKRFVENDPRVGAGQNGTALKAEAGWELYGYLGKDLFGFRALWTHDGTEYWVRKESDKEYGWIMGFASDMSYGDVFSGGWKKNAQSVRCVKDMILPPP